MEYRRLGNSGCQVSCLSLGSWLTFGSAIDQTETNRCVGVAIERGINFFDTADVYAFGQAEQSLAEALRAYPRHDYVLASKTFFPMSDNINDRGLSRKHIFESCHRSLHRLKTDYLDLYQCHRFDPSTPIGETVRAMDDLIRQGKILYWGVSMWNAAQIAQACETSWRLGACPPVTNQPPYNLIQREIEAEVIPTCRQYGLGQIVFSPLAQGLLTAKYRAGMVPPRSRAADDKRGQFLRPRLTDANLDRSAQVADLAASLGLTAAQLSLAWVLQQATVSSAILGISRVEQLEENLGAVDQYLEAATLRQLDEWNPPAAGQGAG